MDHLKTIRIMVLRINGNRIASHMDLLLNIKIRRIRPSSRLMMVLAHFQAAQVGGSKNLHPQVHPILVSTRLKSHILVDISNTLLEVVMVVTK